MKRTSFVCFGTQGNKDALVYQEVPARDGGEEFFLFLSPGAPGQEALLRSLFRDAVSTSRLGAATNYFQRFIDRFGEAIGSLSDTDDPLAGALLMVEIRRGDEVHLLCNRSAAVVHWTSGADRFEPIDSLGGVKEIALRTSGEPRDLFRLAPEDIFVLYHFDLAEGSHTLIGAPSRDFIERSEGKLRDSILFPAFELPPEMGIELDMSRSLPVLHWRRGEVPSRVGRRAAVVRRRTIAAVAAVAAVAAAAVVIARFMPSGTGRAARTTANRSALLSVDDATRDGSVQPERSRGGDDAAATAPVSSLVESWKKKFRGAVTSSPRWCGGRIIFGCRDGFLYSFAADGTLLWKYRSGAGIGASPDCTEDRVACADYRGTISCVDASNGKKIWSVEARSRIVSAPRIWQQQLIAGTTDGRLLAVSLKDGRKIWERKVGLSVRADPALGQEFIVAATTDGTLLRMDHGGRIVWRAAVGAGIYSNPLCLEQQDLVVFGSKNSFIYAYSLSSGALRWRYGAGSEVSGSPAARGNVIYVGARDRNVYALSTDGKLLWRRDVGGAILSEPLLVGSILFVTTYGAKLVALDAETGAVVGDYRAGSPIYSSPESDGKRIYFGSNGGVFYAVGLPRDAS